MTTAPYVQSVKAVRRLSSIKNITASGLPGRSGFSFYRLSGVSLCAALSYLTTWVSWRSPELTAWARSDLEQKIWDSQPGSLRKIESNDSEADRIFVDSLRDRRFMDLYFISESIRIICSWDRTNLVFF